MSHRNKPLSNLSQVQIDVLVQLSASDTAQPLNISTLTRRFLVNAGCITALAGGYVLTVKGKQYAEIAQGKAQP